MTPDDQDHHPGIDPDADLGPRLRALAAELPPVRQDLAGVRTRARLRRRHRHALVGVGTAGLLVVGGVAVARGLGDDGPATTVRSAGDPEATTTSGPAPASPTTAEGTSTTTAGTSTSVPPTTGTTEAPTTTSTTSPPAGGDGPVVAVDEGEDVVVYEQDGSERLRVAPFHDTAYARAHAVGDQVVVLNRGGTQAALVDAATGTFDLVDLQRPVWSDVWSVGLVDGVPTIVTDAYDVGSGGAELVAVSLADGSARTFATVAGGGFSTTSFTADGRVLVHEVLDADLDACPWQLIDVATGERADTALPCLVEPSIGPDGTTAAAHGLEGIDAWDVATGDRVGHWLDGVPVQGEGHQLDYDGRWILSSNAYDDDLHGPFVAVDTETGAVVELPGRGPASVLVTG